MDRYPLPIIIVLHSVCQFVSLFAESCNKIYPTVCTCLCDSANRSEKKEMNENINTFTHTHFSRPQWLLDENVVRKANPKENINGRSSGGSNITTSNRFESHLMKIAAKFL